MISFPKIGDTEEMCNTRKVSFDLRSSNHQTNNEAYPSPLRVPGNVSQNKIEQVYQTTRPLADDTWTTQGAPHRSKRPDDNQGGVDNNQGLQQRGSGSGNGSSRSSVDSAARKKKKKKKKIVACCAQQSEEPQNIVIECCGGGNPCNPCNPPSGPSPSDISRVMKYMEAAADVKNVECEKKRECCEKKREKREREKLGREIETLRTEARLLAQAQDESGQQNQFVLFVVGMMASALVVILIGFLTGAVSFRSGGGGSGGPSVVLPRAHFATAAPPVVAPYILDYPPCGSSRVAELSRRYWGLEDEVDDTCVMCT